MNNSFAFGASILRSMHTHTRWSDVRNAFTFWSFGKVAQIAFISSEPGLVVASKTKQTKTKTKKQNNKKSIERDAVRIFIETAATKKHATTLLSEESKHNIPSALGERGDWMSSMSRHLSSSVMTMCRSASFTIEPMSTYLPTPIQSDQTERGIDTDKLCQTHACSHYMYGPSAIIIGRVKESEVEVKTSNK